MSFPLRWNVWNPTNILGQLFSQSRVQRGAPAFVLTEETVICQRWQNHDDLNLSCFYWINVIFLFCVMVWRPVFKEQQLSTSDCEMVQQADWWVTAELRVLEHNTVTTDNRLHLKGRLPPFAPRIFNYIQFILYSQLSQISHLTRRALQSVHIDIPVPLTSDQEQLPRNGK